MSYDDRPEHALRLEQARKMKGLKSAREAAMRFGWPYDTYAQHENGTRGIQRAAAKYAKAFGVSVAWLLTGEGHPTPAASNPSSTPSSVSAKAGTGIKEARTQQGFTLRQTAEAAGVEVDEVDRWENQEVVPTPEQISDIAKLLMVSPDALARGEVVAIGGQLLGDARFVSDAMPAHSGPRDVEKLGVVAAGDDGDFEFNGQVAEYVTRPRGLINRPGIFALEIISDSMYPAYRKSDIIFCDRTEPSPGDDVVIETFPEVGAVVGKSFVKRLKRRSASTIVVEQFNPPQDLTFDPYAIKHVWRVVPNRELHGY